jgi:Tol biopolymer transport system component
VDESFRPAISATGRYVAFDSYATNMVPDDLNGGFDVFVRDRVEHTTERVSVDSSGAEADGESTSAAISSNGRFVVFESGADNLDPADTNQFVDVFVHDRKTGATQLVSAGVGGVAGDDISVNADISGDGRYIAFASKASNVVANDANGSIADVFVRDRVAGTTQLVSVSTGGLQSVSQASLQGTISDDGSVITFDSFSSRLVPHDTNHQPDVFAHSMESGVTRRVSVSTTGQQGNLGGLASAIAGGGACVSFTSGSTNLVRHDTNGVADILLRRFAS